MKYLFAGNQTPERLALLLSLTKISSEPIREGLEWHLVKSMNVENAAALAGVKTNNLVRAIDKLNTVAETVEQIKELDGVL